MGRAVRGLMLIGVLLVLAGCAVHTPVRSVRVYTEVNLLPGEPTQEGFPILEHTPTPTPALPTPGVSPTWTPPPTFTRVPSATPAPGCILISMRESGMNKRTEPSTGAEKVSSVGFGSDIRAVQFVEGNQYLWAYDTNEPPGWVTVRNRDVWWLTGVEQCNLLAR